ncbi:DUF4174 domain-containing protein [Bordetella sp. N]|uniref:DUF4174 domain-containing protein n=1 Tax=Bordetella sp. N TaxID=1746199 RepID=UPI00070BF1F6|nr:DUF4174 domain-containing protein [Bordetella sp. N]ALM83044.1 hypothetical protein ASB57_08845 [Bordetella sp. N]
MGYSISRSGLAAGLAAALAVVPAAGLAAGPASMDAMRWHQRVVLVSSSDAADPNIAAQRRILDEWKAEAADRDVILVQVAGSAVEGTTDSAAGLRKRYELPASGFQALLIGKDGHVALRSAQPIPAATLAGAIDAMPMRKAGQR